MKTLKIIILAVFLSASFSGTGNAIITFRGGWDSDRNSNVKKYTKREATKFLSDYSDKLEEMIEGPQNCIIEVTKGCHQPRDPHFTINGINKKGRCNKTRNHYNGTKSVHIPCP